MSSKKKKKQEILKNFLPAMSKKPERTFKQSLVQQLFILLPLILFFQFLAQPIWWPFTLAARWGGNSTSCFVVGLDRLSGYRNSKFEVAVLKCSLPEGVTLTQARVSGPSWERFKGGLAEGKDAPTNARVVTFAGKVYASTAYDDFTDSWMVFFLAFLPICIYSVPRSWMKWAEGKERVPTPASAPVWVEWLRVLADPPANSEKILPEISGRVRGWLRLALSACLWLMNFVFGHGLKFAISDQDFLQNFLPGALLPISLLSAAFFFWSVPGIATGRPWSETPRWLGLPLLFIAVSGSLGIVALSFVGLLG